MALRKVVTEGDEILRKRCKEVTAVDDRIRMILDDMLETMRNEYGVGIAAPQVGIMRRMIVVEAEEGQVYQLVNPVIVESRGSQKGDEGCLSVPGYIGTVERPEYVRVEALDRDGKGTVVEAEGFPAVVLCHECDHLEGILYIDKAENLRPLENEEEEEQQA